MSTKNKKPSQRIEKGDMVAPRNENSPWKKGRVIELDCFGRYDGPRVKIVAEKSNQIIYLMAGQVTKI